MRLITSSPKVRFLLPHPVIELNNMKKSWDQFFIDIAIKVSERATCNRKKVGCVLVRDNNILSTGYNGSPPKSPECIDVGCYMIDDHCERCNHAEVNSICQAALKGVNLGIGEVKAYITSFPCHECLRTLLCTNINVIIVPMAELYKDGKYVCVQAPELERNLILELIKNNNKISIIGI